MEDLAEGNRSKRRKSDSSHIDLSSGGSLDSAFPSALERPSSPKPSLEVHRPPSPQPTCSLLEEYVVKPDVSSATVVHEATHAAPKPSSEAAQHESTPQPPEGEDLNPTEIFDTPSLNLNWLGHGENIIYEEGEREEEVDENVDYEELKSKSGNVPVYSGAPITLHQSLVSILTLALRFSLSGQCIQAILKVIQLHCLDAGNVFVNSLFLFKKYFSMIQGQADYEYYCSQCFTQCEKSKGCPQCKKSPLCCLIKLSLVKQLQTMFTRSNFFDKLVPLVARAQSSGIHDIYDGALYKEYIERGLIGELPSLSFMWYTDGAALYKSSKTSVWPLFLSINELPFSERFCKENLLVAALWCGPVKPHGNILIKAAYPELQKLSDGVEIEIKGQGTKQIKGVVLNGTGDSPARACMLNMTMHNGEHSCQKCEQKGEPRPGVPGVRLFPYCPEEMKLRDKENFSRHGQLALYLRGRYAEAYMGVKGPTMLEKISLDPIRGTSIDEMHLIFGGLAKLHLKFFVKTEFSSLESNISKQLRTVLDERLLSIKPPHFLTRVPRSTAEMGIWNTSQFKSFFLYYSLPALKDLVPERRFNHYSSLVAAVQYLNSDMVTPTCIDNARQLISKYLAYFQDLHDKNFMTLNIHLLAHLPDVVQEQGPLWVTSCFPLESINGIILNLVHGTRYPEMQIATSLHMCLGLQDLVENLQQSPSKTFCEDLMKKTHHVQSEQIGNDTIIGKCSKLDAIPDYLTQTLKAVGLDASCLKTFNCLRRNREFYAADSYNRSLSRDSSTALYSTSKQRVGLLKTFLRSDSNLFVVIQELEIVDRFSTLLPGIPVPNIAEYKALDQYAVLPTSVLQSVCVKIVINNRLYLAQRCNKHETE